jgi:hypothetical protein
MTNDFHTSNLSKIKPKLRTQGRVSGNFGKSKVKANSPMRDIGTTNSDVVRITTPDEYLGRLYKAYDITDDPNLKQFLYNEIRKILIQRNLWK